MKPEQKKFVMLMVALVFIAGGVVYTVKGDYWFGILFVLVGLLFGMRGLRGKKG